MFTTWDKALVPFIIAGIGVLVYFGVLNQDQAASFQDKVIPAVVALIQAVLVYAIPNKAST